MRTLLPILVLATLTTSFSEAGEFRAGAARVDITPDTSQPLIGYGPRFSEGVHDRIFHRVVALDDGQTTFILVSSELGALSTTVYEEVATALEERTGVKKEHFWWALTHTHAAPAVGSFAILGLMAQQKRPTQLKWDPAYKSLVMDRLLQAAEEAIHELAPARLAIGKGRSLANMNRRAEFPDGRIGLGLNPDRPVDHEIGVIRLEHHDQKAIAVIANYAMHGTALGAVKEISGDAQGVVASYIERKLGVPMLYVNGAAGNVTPIYFFDYHFRNLPMFEVLLGEPILEANQSMRARDADGMKLQTSRIVVETPLKEGLTWPEDLPDYYRVNDAGEGLIRLPVYFLRLGRDTVIWAAPIELFTQVAMKIRDLSPFTNTFFFGYTNGYMAYLPVKEAYPEGGYEIRVAPYTEKAAKDLTRAVLTHLHGMTQSP